LAEADEALHASKELGRLREEHEAALQTAQRERETLRDSLLASRRNQQAANDRELASARADAEALLRGRETEAAKAAARVAAHRTEDERRCKGERLVRDLDSRTGYEAFTWKSESYVKFSDYIAAAYGDEAADHKPKEHIDACASTWGWTLNQEFRRRTGPGAGTGRPWICKITALRQAIVAEYGALA